MPLPDGGRLALHPDVRRCVITNAQPPSIDAMAHPWLATIGASIANLRGSESFHAGGVVIAGRAWVILGEKHAGKSTTLAILGELGHVITSDDLVVVHGATVQSGPACVDLREEAATALSLGEQVTVMPGRVRWRVTMARPPAEVPLAGFVRPAWSADERSSVRSVPAADRLQLLFRSRSALWRDNRGLRMLRLASLPIYEWRRPRSLAAIADEAQQLAARLSDG
ncbi:hypothetical protein [uncultured Jatrophihabitans sp.]|uniref:hypothetical protein n=1 Tax=uncultured Jatrophihabitans sp. TaxID=1610747 RepID=UPI0035C9FBCE